MNNHFIILNLFLVILFLTSSYTFALDIKHIKGVNGSCIIPPYMTLEDGKEIAITEAKKEALRKAEIPENISATEIIITSQGKESLKQYFESFSSSEIQGAAYYYEIIDERKEIDEFDNVVYSVILDVDIIKYDTKKDESLDINIEGLKASYNSGDVLNFYFTPYQNGYLTIFNLIENLGFIIYPFYEEEKTFLNDEPDRLFKKYEKTFFPINKIIGNKRNETGYSLEINNEKDSEMNRLIFVYTKQNIPFYEKTINLKNILKWIYQITPDNRVVKYFEFVINNND